MTMQVRVTGITVDQPLPVRLWDVIGAASAAFGVRLDPETTSLDGMPHAMHALPVCVDTLLRSGRHLLSINHDGAGHWSARLLSLPGT